MRDMHYRWVAVRNYVRIIYFGYVCRSRDWSYKCHITTYKQYMTIHMTLEWHWIILIFVALIPAPGFAKISNAVINWPRYLWRFTVVNRGFNKKSPEYKWTFLGEVILICSKSSLLNSQRKYDTSIWLIRWSKTSSWCALKIPCTACLISCKYITSFFDILSEILVLKVLT